MRLNDDDLEGLGFFDSLLALGTKAMEVRSQIRTQRSAELDASRAAAAAKARAKAAAEAAAAAKEAPATSSPATSSPAPSRGGFLGLGLSTGALVLLAGGGYMLCKGKRGRR